MQVAMERTKGKLSLCLVAALLLFSVTAAVEEQKEGAVDTQSTKAEEAVKVDPATKLLMWVQQNDGVVSY